MNEAQFRAKCNKLLQRLGFWTISGDDAKICPCCHTKILPQEGRPDTLCLRFHGSLPSVVVEYKMMGKPGKSGPASSAFSCATITPPQRRYLHMVHSDTQGDMMTLEPVGGPYLGVCTVHGRAGAKSNPRRAWLIPWEWYYMKEAEFIKLTGGLKSIPLGLYKGMRYGTVIEKHRLTWAQMFENYELRWSDGDWWFVDDPDSPRPYHPLYLHYVVQERFGDYENPDRLDWDGFKEMVMEEWGWPEDKEKRQ